MTRFQKWLLVIMVLYMLIDIGGEFGVWFAILGYYGMFMVLFAVMFS